MNITVTLSTDNETLDSYSTTVELPTLFSTVIDNIASANPLSIAIMKEALIVELSDLLININEGSVPVISETIEGFINQL